MRAIRVDALKDRLIECLRIVASGETVLVVDRDRVVAEFAPPRAGHPPDLAEDSLEDAVRGGLLAPASSPSQDPPPGLPIARREVLLAELEADREER